MNSGGRSQLSYAAHTYFNERRGRRDNISTRERERERELGGRGHDEMHCRRTRMKRRDRSAQDRDWPDDILDLAAEAVTQTLRHLIRLREKKYGAEHARSAQRKWWRRRDGDEMTTLSIVGLIMRSQVYWCILWADVVLLIGVLNLPSAITGVSIVM